MIPGDYLVILGDDPMRRHALSSKASARRPALRSIHKGPCCEVLADLRLPHARLDEGRGVILGFLQGPDGAAFIHQPGGRPSAAMPDWQAITRDNWGEFLVVAEDPGDGSQAGRAIHLARSVLGQLPAYHVSHAGLHLLSNAPRLLKALGVELAIDHAGLARHLLYPVARGARTCLEGLCELEGGHYLKVGPEGLSVRPYWSPWSHAGRAGQLDDLRLAPPIVRERILAVTRHMTRGRSHVLLGLSGGLDSSVLAASLSAAGVDYSCFTLVTPDGSGDERAHARLVAQHLGRPLHEIEERVEDIDIADSAASHLPRPVARCFAQSGDKVQTELAGRLGCDAFMSGGGGDNSFCYVHSARPLADRLLSEGVTKGVLATARDLALLTDSPLLQVLHAGVRAALRRRRDYGWSPDRSFLQARDLEKLSGAHAHIWMRAPVGELPGKAQHIAWILGVLNHVEGFVRETQAPTLWPLIAQPVVEACLAIPTWAWLGGGQNRVVARQAFADLLPHATTARRTKGSPDSFAIRLFEDRRAQIRDFLCGGWLAAEGFVDTDAIARRCAAGPVHRDMSCWSIFRLVDAESWVRSWIC